jgi:hypothetical protein
MIFSQSSKVHCAAGFGARSSAGFREGDFVGIVQPNMISPKNRLCKPGVKPNLRMAAWNFDEIGFLGGMPCLKL